MTTVKYQTRAGVTQYRPVCKEAEYRRLTSGLEDPGFCLACGAEAYGVEPDARRYPCESCEQPKVYGLEELLIMRLLTFQEKAQ